jgi:hypothetical protein
MMAGIAISRKDAIDAEFETLAPASVRVNIPKSPPKAAHASSMNGEFAQLDLLRQAFEPDAKGGHPDGLTLPFLFFTLLAALAVFWVSGGRALLY